LNSSQSCDKARAFALLISVTAPTNTRSESHERPETTLEGLLRSSGCVWNNWQYTTREAIDTPTGSPLSTKLYIEEGLCFRAVTEKFHNRNEYFRTCHENFRDDTGMIGV
jgi:hypothetical protein